ncbi:leucyl aminopeptidase family protein [Candidatus Peregrinibacteria bacterium]|nr:leucyl aminopeptidase family protein [Candidatus Peregrinibacteria bacterium]
MEVLFANKPSENSLLVYPVFAKKKVADLALNKLVARLAAAKEFACKIGQTFFVLNGEGSSQGIILLGLGEAKELDVPNIMDAFGTAGKSAGNHHPAKLSIFIPEELHKYAQEIAEAIVLSNYQPAAPYKTGESQTELRENSIKSMEVTGLGKNEAAQNAFRKGIQIAEIVNEARMWVNTPPNIANTDFFRRKSKEIAREIHAKLKILRRRKLRKLNMWTFLGVNRGSPDEAHLITLDYCPKGVSRDEAPTVLVGKGVIFDAGGYNLKPRGSIEDMHLDKAGAVAVLSLMRLLPKLGIKKHIVCVTPFTENLIGQNAYKPSEILKTHLGKTVEITNTDAEGRLILGEAISYAVEKFKPAAIVDLATLTGACMIALGDRYAGLFGNDKALIENLRSAGDETDELLWQLPIHKDYADKMKGQFADLRNSETGSERFAGASKGAAFIREFVGKTKWAHIDIAGPAFTTDPKKYEQKGATGFGVRLLARFMENLK